MKDRFDLENEITQIHTYADQLGMVCENIMDGDSLDKDDIFNVLTGIKILLDMHGDKLYDTMCQVLKLNSYNKELV